MKSTPLLRLLFCALAIGATALTPHAQVTSGGTFCKCTTDTLYEQPEPAPDVPDCVLTFGVEVWGSIEGQCRELPACRATPLKCTFNVVVFARSVAGDPCEWEVTVDETPVPVNSSGNVNTQAITAPACGQATVIRYVADDVDLGTISLWCEDCTGGIF